MNNRVTENWHRLFQQKKDELEEEGPYGALDIGNFDEFQTAIEELTRKYEGNVFPSILHRLRPSLDHIKSFTAALSSATQYDPLACLIWGSMQAVLQCAYACTNTVDEIVGVISELNRAMPRIESYMQLYPNARELNLPLQRLYDDYVSFCLEAITYYKRSGSVKFLSYLWTSKPETLLQQTRKKIHEHIEDFERGVTLAQRRKANKDEILSIMNDGPLHLPKTENTQSTDLDSAFPVTTVTMFRNRNFLGRETIIQEMSDTFKTQEATEINPNIGDLSLNRQTTRPTLQSPACCLLTGLGGIGKTQTALEYLYRYEEEYDAQFWVHAENHATLSSQFAAIADKLQLMDDKNAAKDGQDQGRASKQVLNWLRVTKHPWIIVFDNVEDINDLQQFVPSKSAIRGHIIITTQHSDFYAITDIFKPICMTNFNRDDGSKLLFSYLQREPSDEHEEECAKQLSDWLGGLPLALTTMGGYISASDCPVEEVTHSMKTSSLAFQWTANGQVKQYEKTLKTVFEIALKEMPPKAKDFIQILAFLNPNHIPEDLFFNNTESPVKDRSELTEAVRELKKRQLIRRDTTARQPYLSVHRTVQWNTLLDLSQDKDHRWRVCRRAFDILCAKLPAVSKIDNPEPEAWEEFKKYVPQILSLRTHCLWPVPPVELPTEFVQVLNNTATFMWHAGLTSEGYDALLTAEHILDDKNTDELHPLRADIHEHIGIIASFGGVSKRKEAMDRRHKAIEGRQAAHAAIPKGKVTREDEIRLYNVQSDMAFGLMQLEDFDKSEEYIEKCHEQYKKWGGPEEIPFEYLKYHHITSYIRMYQNKPQEAIKHCKKAAELGEACAGINHPMTQLCRFSLTNHLYLANLIDRALEISESVLKIRSQVCTEFNLFTIESHVMCAWLKFHKNEPAKAERHLLSALDSRKRAVWNEEGVARAQYIYSMVLESMKKYPEADAYRKAALETKNRFLKEYPEYLRPDPDDMVVFDQMVCLWAGRFHTALAQEPFLYEDAVELPDITRHSVSLPEISRPSVSI